MDRWDPRVFDRFCQKHGISQSRLIELMRSHGYPSIAATQVCRWKRGYIPKEVTRRLIVETLRAVREALGMVKPDHNLV